MFDHRKHSLMGVCETVYSDRAELMTQWAVGVNPQDSLLLSFRFVGSIPSCRTHFWGFLRAIVKHSSCSIAC